MQGNFPRHLILFFSTGFGSGYSPLAPGTAGSFVGVALFLGLVRLPLGWILICTLFLFFFGVWVSGRTEALIGKKDPGCVVIDEIAGQWISLLAIPLDLRYYAAAFFLFRFFDIVKPFRRVESLPNGWGIMLDDVVAGLFANATLQIILLLLRNG